jgi:hypothetical protein
MLVFPVYTQSTSKWHTCFIFIYAIDFPQCFCIIVRQFYAVFNTFCTRDVAMRYDMCALPSSRAMLMSTLLSSSQECGSTQRMITRNGTVH